MTRFANLLVLELLDNSVLSGGDVVVVVDGD
jgi:hypothetical protein